MRYGAARKMDHDIDGPTYIFTLGETLRWHNSKEELHEAVGKYLELNPHSEGIGVSWEGMLGVEVENEMVENAAFPSQVYPTEYTTFSLTEPAVEEATAPGTPKVVDKTDDELF